MAAFAVAAVAEAVAFDAAGSDAKRSLAYCTFPNGFAAPDEAFEDFSLVLERADQELLECDGDLLLLGLAERCRGPGLEDLERLALTSSELGFRFWVEPRPVAFGLLELALELLKLSREEERDLEAALVFACATAFEAGADLVTGGASKLPKPPESDITSETESACACTRDIEAGNAWAFAGALEEVVSAWALLTTGVGGGLIDPDSDGLLLRWTGGEALETWDEAAVALALVTGLSSSLSLPAKKSSKSVFEAALAFGADKPEVVVLPTPNLLKSNRSSTVVFFKAPPVARFTTGPVDFGAVSEAFAAALETAVAFAEGVFPTERPLLAVAELRPKSPNPSIEKGVDFPKSNGKE
jgi:hypothetical protein